MRPDTPTRASCLYTGHVRHRRYAPVRHEFRYPLCLALFDLDELAHLHELSPLWRHERPAPVSFRRTDYFGDPALPLDQSVRGLVAQRTGRRPQGPVRLLNTPRLFGYGFNPVSFYFCYAAGGDALETIVAEVTNTPWHERHCYVLPVPAPRRHEPVHRFATPKVFHVSPFMDMRMDYDWRVTAPAERLSVCIFNRRNGQRLFDACMTLRRRPLTRHSLARHLILPCLGAVRITAGIYFEALRLWMKGAPFYPHPRYRDGAGAINAPALPRQPHIPAQEIETDDQRHRAA